MTHISRNRQYASLAAILALATFLRLYQIDLIDLRFDEASTAQWALEIAKGNWQLIAPYSGSVANHPPVMLYALAVPYVFTNNVLVVAVWRGLLDVAAIPLIWLVCKRHLNARVALLACLLFAVAPWAVQLGRNLRPVALPLTTTLLFFGLLEAVHVRAGKTNDWGWPMAGLGFALSVGNHLAAAYLAPIVVMMVAVALFTRRLHINTITLLALLPVLILAGSYVWYDAHNGWRNISGYLRMMSEPATLNDEALRYALWGSGGAHLSDFTGGAFEKWQAQVSPWLNGLDTLQMGLLMLGLVVCAIKLIRTKRLVFLLMLAWFVLPVALQLRHARPVQMHYFTSLYPVSFVLMALAVNELLSLRRGVQHAHVLHGHPQMPDSVPASGDAGATCGHVALLGILMVIVIWQLFTTFRFYDFVGQYDTSLGGYGLPMRNSLRTARSFADGPGDTIVVTPGGDPLVNEMATVFDVLLAGQPHRFANANESLILREQPARYIFTPNTDEAYLRLLRYAQIALTQTVPVRAGSKQNYIVVETQGVNLTQMQPASAQPWQSGAQLLGYQTQTQVSLTLETFIKVWRPAPSGADYHWYHHLYQANEKKEKIEKIAQADIGGVYAANWREGDILLHWVALPLPPNNTKLTVRVGSYTYPQLQTVMLVDAAGGVVDDGVSLKVK